MYQEKFVATIKCDGKVLREKNGTVYLPFGSDYSILLKNLNSRKAKVNISIDDEDILNGRSLIIDQNSSTELKRFLTDDECVGPKLKFVEKTECIRSQRGENSGMDGIIRISFQYEKYSSRNITHYYHNTSPNYYNPYPYYPNDFKFTSSSSNSVDGLVRSVVDNDVSINVSNTLNEDGMTVMGEEIHQNFQTVNDIICEDEIHVICLVLKGDINQEKVSEVLTVKSKIQCKKCGKNNKWNSNFCSVCGNNLKY